jgi:hypothetical protein
MAINIPLENILPGVRESRGVYTTFPYTADLTVTAVNATATLTAAQVDGGYISVTSTAAVGLTMPTGTLLGAQVGASQGYVFDLYIDNTASTGSGVVTMIVGTNAIQSDWATQITVGTASGAAAPVLPLVVQPAALGTACYRIVFSSATAYTFTRTS